MRGEALFDGPAMIDIRTVLVLGAGASHPYGFPLGYQLMEQAVHGDMRRIKAHLLTPDPEIAAQLDDFRRQLAHSKCGSIDVFLEGRPEFESAGKAVIAFYLMSREKEVDLLGAEREQDWYAYLVDLLLTDGVEKLGRNKLSIITYNYDRSLEHYMLTVLQARYGMSRETSVEAFSQIPIIHVHGTLGELTDDSTTGCLYEGTVNSARLKLAMEGIRIAHDAALATDREFVRARNELAGADHVIFLGFGYLKDNIRRLDLNENRKKNTECFGTAVGLTPSEMEFIFDLFPLRERIVPPQPIMAFDADAVNVRDFIRNNLNLFRKRSK